MSPEAWLALRALAVTTLLLAVAAALRWGARRSAGVPAALALLQRAAHTRPRSLRLIDTLYLPERASLHVVEAGGRRLLVGRAATAVTLLGELGGGDAARR